MRCSIVNIYSADDDVLRANCTPAAYLVGVPYVATSVEIEVLIVVVTIGPKNMDWP